MTTFRWVVVRMVVVGAVFIGPGVGWGQEVAREPTTNATTRPATRTAARPVEPKVGKAPRAGVRPIPAEIAVAEVKAGLKQRFGEDYKDPSAAAKRRLAGIMLREAHGAAGDAALYVALHEARTLAAESGEVELALQAAGELGHQFDVDAESVRFATMQACAGFPKLSPQQAGLLAKAARGVAEARLSEDDFEGASRAARIAEETSRRSGEPGLQTELALLADFCQEVVRLAPGFRGAMDKLAKEPENSAANQSAGEFLVLVKQEWGRGLLMLSRGTDAGLKTAAGVELSGARGAELMAAGEAWAVWGQKKQGPGRGVALRHARTLLEGSLEGLPAGNVASVLEKIAGLVGVPGAELADVRAARSALGDARFDWWESLRFGTVSDRDDGAKVQTAQVSIEWKPRLDEHGNLIAMPEESAGNGGGVKTPGLTYRLRVLCVDEGRHEHVLEKEGKVTLRNPDKPVNLQGPSLKDVKRLNGGKAAPLAFHLQVFLDGVKVSEKVSKVVNKRAWWLDDEIVEKK